MYVSDVPMSILFISRVKGVIIGDAIEYYASIILYYDSWSYSILHFNVLDAIENLLSGIALANECY